MKTKKLKNITRGFVNILPVVFFILILKWVFSMILSSVSWIGTFVFDNLDYEIPTYLVNIISFVLLVFLVWIIGVIMNEKHLGHRLRQWFAPLVAKVPLLSTLFKITNQVTHTLQNTNSFRETVLLKFPTPYTYSIGFITGEHPELIENTIENSNLVTVFVPTTPNPTNGYLIVVDKKDLIHTEIPVSVAVSYVISMGTTGVSDDLLKSTQVSEWDFFSNTFEMLFSFIIF